MNEHIAFIGHSFIRRMQRDGFYANSLDLWRTKLTWKGYYSLDAEDVPLNLVKEMVWFLDSIMAQVEGMG